MGPQGSISGFSRTITSFVLVMFLGGAMQQVQGQEVTRPNILWLIAEDIGLDFGVYDTPEVLTPNLDALARQGQRFDRAFATAPVCSPSRSAFHTGMYQMSIGAHHHRSHRKGDGSPYPWPLPDGVRLITDRLRDAGYFTANIRDLPEEMGFKGTNKTDWNFTYEGRPFDSMDWSDLKAHQPFFAEINFPETHRGREWRENSARVKTPANPAKVVFPPYYPDHPVVREDWATYLNSVMALDAKIGAVLAQLEKDGLAENTIVVFMGDNGRAMLRDKQWPYESGLHVPLMVHIPPELGSFTGYRAGDASTDLVMTIDVTATLLSLAGLPQPESMQGAPFLGPSRQELRRYVFGGRDRGDETVDRIRTVRNDRYRYIRNYYPERPFLQRNRYKEAEYPAFWVLQKLASEGRLTGPPAQLLAPTRPPEELYDLQEDPYEIDNLADSPAHQDILNDLRTVLDEWITGINDQGAIPEDPAVARHYEREVGRLYDDRIEALRKEWSLAP